MMPHRKWPSDSRKGQKKFIDKWINATIAYGPGELKHFLIPVNSIAISFGVVKYEIAYP